MLALATAKCARIITDEYSKQRDAIEKANANSKESDRTLLNTINKEYRDEKAVKNAINKISSGEYKMIRKEEEPVEAVEQTVEADAAADAE